MGELLVAILRVKPSLGIKGGLYVCDRDYLKVIKAATPSALTALHLLS